MSHKAKPDSSIPPYIYLTAIFMFYVFFAGCFGLAYRYAINPDGISELRLAGYLSEGLFMRSVVSGWCPLNIWFMALFLFLGYDGLTAARITMACYGAGLLICCWFLTLRFGLSEKNRFISVLIAALLISFWTVKAIAADILIAALILSYIYVVTSQNVLNNKRVSFLCGLIGGLSYMAHHYALPFFLVHFPSILLLTGYFDRGKERFPWKRILTAWGIGMTSFLILASVWVSIMSVKYGQLTISSKGGAAHAIMGPKDIDRRHPFFIGGLYKPRDPYAMHVFEDTSEVEFKNWSPFESKEYFIHQFRVIKDNAVYIVNHFVNMSPFFTYAFIICVLFLITLTLFLTKMDDKKKFLYAWFILTFCIYSSGFLLLIARSPRRFYALMIMFLLLSVHFIEELRSVLGNLISDKRRRLLNIYFLIIIICAFALKPGIQFIKSARDISRIDQVNPYKELAEKIKTVPFPSPYAIIRSSQKPHTDIYIAYYLNKQLLGRPMSTEVDDITRELEAAGAKSLLVFDNLEIVEKLKVDQRFIHMFSKKLRNDVRYLHAVNIEQDNIEGWDEEINIFKLN